MEYTGKLIPTKDADASKSRFLFEIDEKWTIDGLTPDNVAGYINHGCEPNCEADIENGKIVIHAIRKITAGDELTFDYGEEYFDEFIKPIGCKCGAKKHLK